jgi:enterochelin esterase-like enzyme
MVQVMDECVAASGCSAPGVGSTATKDRTAYHWSMKMLIAGTMAALFLGSLKLHAQRSDTLRFHSEAFRSERSVVVHLPEFHRYASAEVRMPVIILLDGQHDWFIDPVLNDIRFLQYTHEVPQAIVVTVPHEDRVRESATDSIAQTGMPLLELLTVELPPLLAPYNPGDLTVLVGHSFTASFALYAYLQAPGAFDAVIALSPLHQVDRSLPLVVERLASDPDRRVLLAVGGADRTKDGSHNSGLVNAVNAADPERAEGRLLFREYPSAGHTSLPIIAFPEMLGTLFMPYALRDSLAPVDDNYQMITAPPPVDAFVRELETSWGFPGTSLPWDLAEINGLLSRLANSGYNEHVTALLRLAIELYPNYFGFHAWLGEALLEHDPDAAQAAFRKALAVLEENEGNDTEHTLIKAELEGMLK